MGRLKDKSEYELQYDQMTVRALRERERRTLNTPLSAEKYPQIKPEALPGLQKMLSEVILVFEKGSWYEDKARTIDKWMHHDRELDRIEEASAPLSTIRCKQCSARMEVRGSSFDIDYEHTEKSKLFYFYFCPNGHLPGKTIYSDGSEKIRRRPKCVQCGSEHLESTVTNESPLTEATTCRDCAHVEVTVFEDPPEDPDFETDRARFCMSQKDGDAFLSSMAALKRLQFKQEEQIERDKQKDVYDEIARIQKLTILEVEERIRTTLEKNGYTHILFEKAQTDKDVIIPLSFQDSKKARGEYESRNQAKRELSKSLEPTNWRAFTDGFHFRMGQLDGNIRGYDREEDLKHLVEQRRKKQNHPTSTPKPLT